MAIASTSGTADARESDRHRIDIAAASLPEAVAELSREVNVSIGAEGSLPRLRTPAVKGRMSIAEALARLLAGSGYTARQVSSTAWRIERAPSVSTTRKPGDRPVPSAPPAEVVEPIVVTASKRDQRLDDLPMALSVVRLSDLHRLNPSRSTASIASEVEGLSLTSLGPGRNRMFLRGVADSPFNGESQSTVAVVLDDARVTYSAPDPDIRLVDVDRVEVIKGPQGSLYGTGALGGIYHIVTRHADPDVTELTASAGAEISASGDAGYSASAVANLPLARGQAGLRLVGYTAREPGWIDTDERSDGNSARLLGARAGLGVNAGDHWRLDLTGFIQLLDSHDSQYVYAPGARSRPEQQAEPHDNDLRHISARLARQGGAIDVVLSTGKTWHEVGSTYDATLGAESFGLADPRLLEDERQYRVWDSELRLSGKLGSWDWLFGVSHVRARQNFLWTLSSETSELVIDDDRRKTIDTAAFGDLTIPLGSDFRLNAGARLFHSIVKETRLLPSGLESERQSRSGMTPSLALSWRPRAGRLVYLRYGSAYRHGGSDINASGELETLKSDELAIIEAGWREALGSGGQLDIELYHGWWENLQSDMLQPNGLIETENAGDARISGAEVSFEQPLARGWKLQAGASYTMAKLVHNTLGYELGDRHLPVVPEYVLRGALAYDFKIGRADSSLRLQLRYLGPARLSFDPTLDRPMGKLLESRIEATVAIDGFETAIAVNNLFDSKADSFAFGNPMRFSAARQYTPQDPLLISLAVLKHF